MLLAGDIGGSNTRLILFKPGGGELSDAYTGVFTNKNFHNLYEVVSRFLMEHGVKPSFACFGVAGPVLDGEALLPNLSWKLDEKKLSSDLGVHRVKLINDLEATGYGITELGSEDIVVLNEGAPSNRGSMAVIAAGTGLGEAAIHWMGTSYKPFASEGGHSDFAPRNQIEIELLQYLIEKTGHVSYDYILSGKGIYAIYRFIRDTGRGAEPEWLREKMKSCDPPAVISAVASEQGIQLCLDTIDLFVSIYGAEAGNLALKFKATGGVYIGGGIAPKIAKNLKGAAFFDAFFSKGRMEPLLRKIPVRLIMNDKTALLGAARFATLSVSDQ